MLTIEGAVHDSLLTYEEHAFNEASSVRKRNGIYYYIYGGTNGTENLIVQH